MGKIQISTGKENVTSNTTTVWDRIVALESNLDDIPENIGNTMESLETQLAEIATKTPMLSLDQYDHLKVAVAEGYDYAPALTQMIADLPVNGGTLLIPNKEYGLYSEVVLTKTITLMGFGHHSILRGSGSITTDTDINHKLIVENLKLINTSTNTILKVNKTWTSGGSATFELFKVWFHSESNQGTLLDIYGARESGITNCWFTSATRNATKGIVLRGDTVGGAMNIHITNCQFYYLATGVEATGHIDNIIYLAGIRMINNMMIGMTYGIKFTNADYVTFEHGMMDFTENPIVIYDVPNIKIRDSYLFTATNSKNVVEVYSTKAASQRNYFDISGNHIFSGATTKGDGIVLTGNNSDLGYGLIAENTMYSLNRGIVLKGLNNGRVLQSKVINNIGKNMTTFIQLESGATLCDLENNFGESEITTLISDSGIANRKNVGNKHGNKRSSNKGRSISNGDGVKVSFQIPHSLYATPAFVDGSMGHINVRDIPYSISFDATNVIFEFKTAPPVGTGNVVINWQAEI